MICARRAARFFSATFFLGEFGACALRIREVNRVIRTVFLSSALLLASCTLPHSSSSSSGSGNGPAAGASFDAKPVIDALQMPESAQQIDGYYLIQGIITCHDTDDSIHLVRVKVPVIGKTVDIAAGDVAELQNEAFTVQLSADIPLGNAGPTGIQVSVVDTKGMESDPRSVTVVLQ